MKCPPLSPDSRASFTVPAAPEAPAKPASAPEPQPFEEMHLSDAQLLAKAAKLKRKGYFTIPVSAPTKRFLNAQKLRDSEEKRQGGYAISFKNSAIETTTTAAASRIASALRQEETRLEPLELEVQWPRGTGANQWHQDRLPKALVCLTTLQGSGTEFVTPKVLEEKFQPANAWPHLLEPAGGDAAIAQDIRQAKKDKFYFFAGLSMKEEAVPKLMHRAPKETDRSIFMIRWRQLKHQVAETPAPSASNGNNGSLDSDGNAGKLPKP